MEGENICSNGIYFPKSLLCVMELCFAGYGWNTCLPMGKGEWIPWFALIVFMAFAFPIKLSLSQV